MRFNRQSTGILLGAWVTISSCALLEQSARHGLQEGHYMLQTGETKQPVYVLPETDTLYVYEREKSKSQPKQRLLTIPAINGKLQPLMLKKQSLDIDITSVLLKYRRANPPFPPELTADFNLNMYAGWRFDRYKISRRTSVNGKESVEVKASGFDFGWLAGLGPTPVGPFNTGNLALNEYSALCFQTGMAAFLETSLVSVGAAAGLDFLTGPDRNAWIYHRKIWLGLVVGVALR